MRQLLIVLGLICMTGCGQAEKKITCIECGASISANESQLCETCAKYKADSANKEASKHYEGWGRDFNAAQEQAKAENKSMLVLFTGSDWCPPCQNLHDSVLTSSEFADKVPNQLITVVCDNPRNASLVSPEERKQYQTLSTKYKVSGVPSLFLIDAEGNAYHKIVGYGGTPASEWVSDLMSKVKPAN